MNDGSSAKIHRELVLALESARTRLAVAIAFETKSTPPSRWEYYLQTADRTRRFVKKLRQAETDFVQERQDWIHALEDLRRLPDPSRASRLCQALQEIVARLE
jgi:hypothetical protein